MKYSKQAYCARSVLAGVGASLLCLATPGLASDPSGNDILNFALNLECLEAEFYSFAVFGNGLDDAQRAGGPESVGGQMANLSPEIQEIAKEIANDELTHVNFFRNALGDDAVPCPKIDIGEAFAAAVNAALGTEASPAFNPFADDVSFLLAAFVFEDVGVTAFRGAVEPLQTLVDGPTLSAAAGVLGVEAYHAGTIRTLLLGLDRDGVETPFGSIADIVQAISDLRNTADGDGDQDEGIEDGDGMANIVPTDDNALVYARSVEQVLGIVYLSGDAATPGGFLPEGVNGFFAPEEFQ